MLRALIGLFCFGFGAALSVLLVQYSGMQLEQNAQAKILNNTPGNDAIVSGVITAIDESSITIQPIVFNDDAIFPALRFAITELTTYGEVIRNINGEFYLGGTHYDDARPDLAQNDTVYVLMDRSRGGPLTALNIKKVTITE